MKSPLLLAVCAFSAFSFADSFHAKFSGDSTPSKDDKNIIEVSDPKVRFVKGSKIYTVPFTLLRWNEIGKLCNEMGYAYGFSATLKEGGHWAARIQWGKKPLVSSNKVLKSFSCYAKDPLPKAKSGFIYDERELPNGVTKVSGHKPFSRFVMYKDEENKRYQYLKVTYTDSKLFNAASVTLCYGLGFTHAVVAPGSASPHYYTDRHSNAKYYSRYGSLLDSKFEKDHRLLKQRQCVDFDSAKAAKIEIYRDGKKPEREKGRFWADIRKNKDGSSTLTNILIARESHKTAWAVNSFRPVDICQAFGFSHIHAEKTRRGKYPAISLGKWKSKGALLWKKKKSDAYLRSVTCETLD